MFSTKPKTDTHIQDLINSAQSQLDSYDADSPEYNKILDQIERLYKLSPREKESKVKPDTLVAVFGNLAGIMLILNYERLHVVTSKALSFVLKTKI